MESAVEKTGSLAAAASATVSAVRNRLVEYFDWRPPVVRVPRADCHWLTLDLTGVPRRLKASSIRLQLVHLTGQAKLGFVWNTLGESAVEVWYWDEGAHFGQAPASKVWSIGVAPYPEPLFRPAVSADGLYLFQCEQGLEAVAIAQGKIKKTRWLAEFPNADAWAAFVRDAGYDPATQQTPVVSPMPSRGARVQPGWSLHTNRSGGLSTALLALVFGVAVAGGAVVSVLAYDIKLSWAIYDVRAEYKRIATENAALLDLSRRLAVHSEYFSSVAKAQAPISQLDLMQKLAQLGVFEESTKISLLEWEYRNGRLRLLFSVPSDDFSLSLFLSILEKQGFLREIRLVPDTPPLTLGIQAELIAPDGQQSPGVR